MKILIDINHPAHVHYFRNFIKIMETKGHIIKVVSRNKEIEHYLLKKYSIDYIGRGIGKKGVFWKILYLLKADFIIFKIVKIFKPDILLSFDSVYLAQVAFFTGIPHISFDDTEHATLEHLLSFPFTKHILTPDCYTKDLGNKQIKFNGFMELCYLHPNYFTPDKSIFTYLGIEEDEKYVILRFVAWNASHDVGQIGLTLDEKRKLVKEVSKFAKVFISSENELPNDLEKYQIKIPPEKMHDALYYATMFIGESGTMASECAVFGVPTIYVNALPLMGYLKEEKEAGLLFHFKNSKGILEKAIEILKIENMKEIFQNRREKLLKDKIDVTAFMVWFIENYPKSAQMMKENPEYQNRFK